MYFSFSFKKRFLYLQKNLPSFSALSFHTLWDNANGPSVIPLWVYLFRCLFYHYPSFLNHSIQSILSGRAFHVKFSFFILPALSFDTFQETGSWIFGETFQSAIIPYFEKGMFFFLANFLSTCPHSSLRGLVSISFQRSLLPSLLCSCKTKPFDHFSLLSERADLFIIIS